MKILLMTSVFILSASVLISGARAEEKTVVVPPVQQPQIIVKTKGPRENSPLYPLFAQKPKNTKETTTFTDANGVDYEVVRYTRYDSDGNPTIRTIARGPDGHEVELKTRVETDD